MQLLNAGGSSKVKRHFLCCWHWNALYCNNIVKIKKIRWMALLFQFCFMLVISLLIHIFISSTQTTSPIASLCRFIKLKNSYQVFICCLFSISFWGDRRSRKSENVRGSDIGSVIGHSCKGNILSLTKSKLKRVFSRICSISCNVCHKFNHKI